MPTEPPRPCKRCKKTTANIGGVCEACKARIKKIDAIEDTRRGTSSERGYNALWRKLRTAFLAKNPLCAECKRAGKVKPATDVDHIVPHHGDQKLFWDVSNLQALCKRCHSRKTAKEDGGFGNVNVGVRS